VSFSVVATRRTKKAANRVKASIKNREGPVTKNQDAVPIADAMRAYWDRDMLTFSIPAHNGGRGPAPEFTQWAGIDAARFDLPMSHGVDTRDRAPGAQSTAQGAVRRGGPLQADAVVDQRLVAQRPRRDHDRRGPGDTLVMARNGHKSSFAGSPCPGRARCTSTPATTRISRSRRAPRRCCG
jgi:hypothetical protein